MRSSNRSSIKCVPETSVNDEQDGDEKGGHSRRVDDRVGPAGKRNNYEVNQRQLRRNELGDSFLRNRGENTAKGLCNIFTRKTGENKTNGKGAVINSGQHI